MSTDLQEIIAAVVMMLQLQSGECKLDTLAQRSRNEPHTVAISWISAGIAGRVDRAIRR